MYKSVIVNSIPIKVELLHHIQSTSNKSNIWTIYHSWTFHHLKYQKTVTEIAHGSCSMVGRHSINPTRDPSCKRTLHNTAPVFMWVYSINALYFSGISHGLSRGLTHNGLILWRPEFFAPKESWQWSSDQAQSGGAPWWLKVCRDATGDWHAFHSFKAVNQPAKRPIF